MSEPKIAIYRDSPIKAGDLLKALQSLFDIFETDTGVQVVGVRCERLDSNDHSGGLRPQRPILTINLDMK